MAGNFFDLVGGVKKVRIGGKKQEKIVNMASARGIYIWGIKKNGDKMEFKVRSSGFEALRNIAAENGHEVEVVEEKGFYLLRGIVKRRLGFIIGALVFVLTLYLLSSFVWVLEVSGNSKIDKNRIIITAAKYGLYEGAPKWNFKGSEVEEGILKDLDELSYVKVDIEGVKVNIQVVEKIMPDKTVTEPCHIVAAKDGIVDDILVLQGQPNVKIGDVVAKGDILISGIIFPEDQVISGIENESEGVSDEELKPWTVRARGEVKARVWYEGYGECPLKKETLIMTGNKKKKVYIIAGDRIFNLKKGNDSGFKMVKKEIRENSINTPWGKIGIGTENLYEQAKKVTLYSDKEAFKIARKKALDVIKKEVGKDKELLKIKFEVVSAPSDSLVRVKAEAEVIEDIAVPQPIISR
ncbi:sporulation protein YqfD [Thermosyntropha sp.]|uniref:sporulation protein YqfD n=1 Tax=Thermosyntropha sp. TaxID=2740820 RepID=UPI0025D7EFFA|nr:sporulation protein YqfD [Thermosyntropha sp.]MBO8159139.1 sporulation protein YqfD [Thermosyntropha sp.]